MKNLNITAITAIAATLAAGLLISTSALADTVTSQQQGLTRAEVKAQLAEARARGELTYRPAADFSDDISQAGPALTRAEVKNALVAAQYNGEFAKQNGEDPQRRLPVATPAQVRKADTALAE